MIYMKYIPVLGLSMVKVILSHIFFHCCVNASVGKTTWVDGGSHKFGPKFKLIERKQENMGIKLTDLRHKLRSNKVLRGKQIKDILNIK